MTDQHEGDALPMSELRQLQCLVERVYQTQTELLNNQESMSSTVHAMMKRLNGHSATGHGNDGHGNDGHGNHVPGTHGGHAAYAEQAHKHIIGKLGKLKKPALHRIESSRGTQQGQKADDSELVQREWRHLVDFCCRQSNHHSSCLERLVGSGAFEVVCSVVVVLNTIVMGMAADCEGRQAALAVESGAEPGTCNPPWVEVSFFAFYVLELGLKLAAWRCTFFTRSGWRWNAFDVFLVCSGTTSFIDFGGGADFMWLRILRVARQVVKSLRIFRVVRFCAELRVLVISIASSLNALFWALVTLSMLMYMCAIIFVSGVASYLASDSDIDQEVKQVALTHWSSIGDAMLTLFRSVTGGGPWGNVVTPLRMANEFYHALFLLYIAVLAIAVLKLLTGVFVRHAAAACSLDQQQCIVRSIQELFREIDTDGSGTITLEEFMNHLKDPVSLAYFEMLNIDVVDAERLFHLIDDDGHSNGHIRITEFIEGCQSYKGYAKKLDINLVMNQISALAKSVEMCVDHVIDLHHPKAGFGRLANPPPPTTETV